MKKGIERTAGYVVDYLEWAEEASIQDIVENIDMPQPVVLMSVGFLVKDEKIDSKQEDGENKIFLSK